MTHYHPTELVAGAVKGKYSQRVRPLCRLVEASWQVESREYVIPHEISCGMVYFGQIETVVHNLSVALLDRLR